MLNENDKVKVVLINIYGGVLNVGQISNSLALLSKHTTLNKPYILRLHGTFSSLAKDTLTHLEQAERIYLVNDFDEAV